MPSSCPGLKHVVDPKPTSDVPTARWYAVTAAVGFKYDGLEDHRGAPAKMRNTVSVTRKHAPANAPPLIRWRLLAAALVPAPECRRRDARNNIATTSRPTAISMTGQMKLTERIRA